MIYSVEDPGGDLGGPALPPLFLDQTEARRAKKKYTAPPPPPQLSAKGLDLPLILCFAFQLNVLCFCVSVKSFASVFLPHVAQAEEMILANS